MELRDLSKPFPEADIEWRIQRSGIKNGKPWGMVLAYVTARAIQDRLDEVCGPENWCNEFDKGPEGGILCGISVRVADTGPMNWVTKWNGAENTDIEAIKGGLSAATKRAGVEWGIGRYLYKLEVGWADFCKDGLYSAKIKDNGKDTWHKWNPPELPPWALPGNSMEKSYAEQKERVIAANYDRDDVEYDYHNEKKQMRLADNIADLKGYFGDYFKAYYGNIEAQKILTETYNVCKEKLLGEPKESLEEAIQDTKEKHNDLELF